MDLALLDNENNYNVPYPIEINSFGKEYASGSALFHWITDYDILYGKKQNIFLDGEYNNYK